ncbi:hypothetical protein LB507_010657 [Fusarium sp. FIESC RH6]|nr:hypothetical protein LB507_010657 [Fusarium sp. FIESC RH6]
MFIFRFLFRLALDIMPKRKLLNGAPGEALDSRIATETFLGWFEVGRIARMIYLKFGGDETRQGGRTSTL